MMVRTQLTLSLFAFLVLSLIFLALPQKSFSGLPAMVPGCCDLGNSCGGCVSGCAIPEAECLALGGGSVEPEAICIDNGSTAGCEGPDGTDGCCVIAEGECFDGQIDYFTCVFEAGGTSWFQNADCVDIPRCSETPIQPISSTPIPTLGEWGLLTVTVLLGIAGFIVIRRRRASA